ncbi:hypothetical protein BJI67_06725 [Acidihalobacter aeolianus]|uniref:Uncharacterized protein n=1 Tax=Acidihalobacter aeolianus TaxID=2792603 RepID=A0A1D8K750_9GAMM|nr:hypothetical protein [Acidihalobacter aeolianus]AOV16793.1 hypothetical protein BJI67_06725 [Acidihalobacter aeolianus]
MKLFISINSPSQDMAKSPIDEAITFVAAHAAMENRQGRFPAGPTLDITFMLSSKQEAPPFTGMRMGGYDKQGDTLYFEAAVPEKITQSDAAPRYVALVMQDMVDNAKEYFDEMDIDFDIDNWRRVIDVLTAAETEQAVTH